MWFIYSHELQLFGKEHNPKKQLDQYPEVDPYLVSTPIGAKWKKVHLPQATLPPAFPVLLLSSWPPEQIDAVAWDWARYTQYFSKSRKFK